MRIKCCLVPFSNLWRWWLTVIYPCKYELQRLLNEIGHHVLQFEHEISPTGACFEHLFPSWRLYFEALESL